MNIRFRCSCGRQLQVPAEHGGKKAKCPLCGSEFTCPEAPDPRTVFDRVHFQCSCGKRVTARVYHHIPAKVTCPHCDTILMDAPARNPDFPRDKA